MGCSSGSCGITPRGPQRQAVTYQEPCCSGCAEDDYRQTALNMFNPWPMSPFRNAGKILSEGGTLVGGDLGTGNYNPGASSGSADSTSLANKSASGSSSSGIYGAAESAIGEIGSTARAQINADLERTRIQANADAQRAAAQDAYGRSGMMPGLNSSTQGLNSTGGADSGVQTSSSGAGMSWGILAIAALAAALASGAVKV